MGEVVGVPVEERAVVFGEVFSGRLVFGKVPASGQFGLQSLVTTAVAKRQLFVVRTIEASVYTHPNFPQEVADDVQS